MIGSAQIIAIFPFVLVVITCQDDDVITSGATSMMNSEKVGTDFRCLQYVCLQSNQPLCRGCFWFSDCLGDKKCVTKWCGDATFFKELQLFPNCQDFSPIPQDETEIPFFHRCCTIGRGKRAILVQWDNVTLENSFKQNSEDSQKSKCQILEYVSTMKIRHCQVPIVPVVTTTATNTLMSSSDKKFSSIGGGNTLHQSYLILVVCISVFIIVRL